MEQEIWKPIYGYGNKYEVSNMGNVRHIDLSLGMLFQQEWEGYAKVRVNNTTQFVHRLIAMAFVPNPNNKPEINHINGIKTDNRSENLEWCTRRENTEHAWRTGLVGKSKKTLPNNSKVFDVQRFALLVKQKRGDLSLVNFGKQIGMPKDTLFLIERGNTPSIATVYKILTIFGWEMRQFEKIINVED